MSSLREPPGGRPERARVAAMGPRAASAGARCASPVTVFGSMIACRGHDADLGTLAATSFRGHARRIGRLSAARRRRRSSRRHRRFPQGHVEDPPSGIASAPAPSRVSTITQPGVPPRGRCRCRHGHVPEGLRGVAVGSAPGSWLPPASAEGTLRRSAPGSPGGRRTTIATTAPAQGADEEAATTARNVPLAHA